MQIRILASSSSGNCYWVSDGATPLLLDCGIRFADIRKGIGFRASGLGGCLLTHEHKDHSLAAADLMRAGVEVYTSQGTVEAVGLTGHRLRTVRAMEQLQIGTWAVLPFDAVHDAAEPLGFLAASQTGDKLLYLTDSSYCRYRFQGLTHLVVECNHSLELLRQAVSSGAIPVEHKNRVMRSHMSLERLLVFLRSIDLSRVEAIHLVHLSDGNSDEALFKRRVQEVTGKPVYVAAK